MSEEEQNQKKAGAEADESAEAKAAESGATEEEVTETGAAEEEPKGMSEEEFRAKLEEHFREQKVGDVLIQFLISLSTLAYVKMGLTEDTKDYKDLEQSRLAIDSFKALLEAAESRLPEQDAKALAGALASLQITFAKASEGKE
jgi:cobalamin biosynthesis protein CobT